MAIHHLSLNRVTKITIDFILAEKTRRLIGNDNDKIQCDITPLPVGANNVAYLLKNGVDGEIFPESHKGKRSFIIINKYKEFALISSRHKASHNSDRFHIDQILSADTGRVDDINEDIFIYCSDCSSVC